MRRAYLEGSSAAAVKHQWAERRTVGAPSPEFRVSQGVLDRKYKTEHKDASTMGKPMGGGI